jgi:hypothetical protein
MFELYRAFRHTKAGRTPGSGICRQISLTNSIYKVMPVSSNNAFPMLLTNTSNPNNMVLGKLAPFLLLFFLFRRLTEFFELPSTSFYTCPRLVTSIYLVTTTCRRSWTIRSSQSPCSGPYDLRILCLRVFN